MPTNNLKRIIFLVSQNERRLIPQEPDVIEFSYNKIPINGTSYFTNFKPHVNYMYIYVNLPCKRAVPRLSVRGIFFNSEMNI